MSGVLVLDRNETRAAVPLDELLDAVRAALIAISRGETSAPPRIAARAAGGGLLGAMPGYVHRMGLAAKLVSVFPDAEGSSHRGIVGYFDAETGAPLAVLDAQTITALRTAAAATVALQALARPDATRIAVLGTGTQARAQLEYLSLIGPMELAVGARNRERGERLVAEHGAGSVTTVESAARGADIVCCCTSAREPIVARSWLGQGVHVSSVGGSEGPELDTATIRDGTLFAEWPGTASERPPAGAWELQGTDPARLGLLGAVLDGQLPGRTAAAELTVFKSTGHAALDVAAASVAYRNARNRGLGVRVDL